MICGNNMNVLLFLLFMLGDGITIKYITNSFFPSRTSWLSYECQNRLNNGQRHESHAWTYNYGKVW